MNQNLGRKEPPFLHETIFPPLITTKEVPFHLTLRTSNDPVPVEGEQAGRAEDVSTYKHTREVSLRIIL